MFDKGDAEVRRRNLLKNGATAEEAEFLLTRRVELNALHSDELVAFVEYKLQQNGVRKLVPKRATLVDTYKLFKRGVEIRELVEQGLAKPNGIRVPADLVKQVHAYLEENPEAPWDAAVAHIAGWSGK